MDNNLQFTFNEPRVTSHCALLKSPIVISTEVPTCRDEVEKSIKKQIPRLGCASLGMTFSTEQGHGSRNIGSALILTVVLTSLLALIGVMFIMMARVDRMATSAISENRELNFAVETVVAEISQELILDVPGMPKGGDYYDYPDANNAWLASLEPYNDGTDYRWRQISDVTGYIRQQYINGRWGNWPNSSAQNDVQVDAAGYNETGGILPYYINRKVITDYPEIALDEDGQLYEQWADADGDGIADSKWIELDDITSDKGKPIYAAIRIVDNGGMLNVNTANEFDPTASREEIDGSSQLQINLEGLLKGSDTIDNIDASRNPAGRTYSQYQDEFIWRIEDPCFYYRPFDISDELELKYRYCIDSNFVSRFENTAPFTNAGAGTRNFGYLYDGSTSPDYNLVKWQSRITDPLYFDAPDRRHLLTTYSIDRIIDPNGEKMVNINRADANSIYGAIKSALGPGYTDANKVAAQITANLIDYIDGPNSPRYDPNDYVTVVRDDTNTPYYGFERPCIYISELAHRLRILAEPGPISYTLRRSYAIELHKPYYPEDSYPDPNQWRLIIQIQGYPDSNFPINWSGTKHFHVVCLDDPCEPISPFVNFDLSDSDLNFPLRPYVQTITIGYNTIVTSVSLQRKVGNIWISVDSKTLPLYPSWLVPAPLPSNEGTRSYKRDITQHKCIRRLWDDNGSMRDSNSIGQRNPSYTISESPDIFIQAHPEDKLFTNVGEIGILLRKSAYSQGPNPIGPTDTEREARLNLADPCCQNLFQYLTVFDPTNDGIDYNGDGIGVTNVDPNELKIPGRININTAPWFVLAQLPWVSQRSGGYDDPNLARAIVAYRDKVDLSTMTPPGPDYYHGGAFTSRALETGITGLREKPGFASIGELATVINNNAGQDNYNMRYYTLGSESGKDLGFPDLTGNEGAIDDFEERDVIFARISNLVTVRSDVFTAYILVRIGHDGPQKRFMAILDRSNVSPPAGGKVRIIAIHPVPDPR
jgi:hypothetical protein